MSVGRCIISRSPVLLSLLSRISNLSRSNGTPFYIKIGSNVSFNEQLFTSNTFIPIDLFHLRILLRLTSTIESKNK